MRLLTGERFYQRPIACKQPPTKTTARIGRLSIGVEPCGKLLAGEFFFLGGFPCNLPKTTSRIGRLSIGAEPCGKLLADELFFLGGFPCNLPKTTARIGRLSIGVESCGRLLAGEFFCLGRVASEQAPRRAVLGQSVKRVWLRACCDSLTTPPSVALRLRRYGTQTKCRGSCGNVARRGCRWRAILGGH